MSSLRDAYSSRRRWALGLDLVLVVVFAIIGRASHAEGLTFGGILGTAWPFVVACLVGWVIVTVARLPHALVWPAGLVLWVVTVAGGVGLRVFTGDTAATPFIVVASLVLAAFLLAPRILFGRRATGRPGGRAQTGESPASPSLIA